MGRNLVSSGLFAACLTVGVLAATERATFILTDGERKSGAVVFHTESRENLINGHLNLGNDNGGPEFTFPVNQVAVIDFAGGQPTPAELARLPASGQLLALRNGQTALGTFVNLIGGETLIWRDQSGQTQQYPLPEVTRVYLQPQVARSVYNYSGPPARAVGTAGQTAPGTVVVQANQAWTDSGLTVKKGDRVSFITSGQVSFGTSPGMTAGPDGNASFHKATYPVPEMSVGGLIGRVSTGKPFPIGSNSQPITMPNDGRLMLGVNDDELGDNSGAFNVIVKKQ